METKWKDSNGMGVEHSIGSGKAIEKGDIQAGS